MFTAHTERSVHLEIVFQAIIVIAGLVLIVLTIWLLICMVHAIFRTADATERTARAVEALAGITPKGRTAEDEKPARKPQDKPDEMAVIHSKVQRL